MFRRLAEPVTGVDRPRPHPAEFDGRIVDARFYETRLDDATSREIVAATSPRVGGDEPPA